MTKATRGLLVGLALAGIVAAAFGFAGTPEARIARGAAWGLPLVVANLVAVVVAACVLARRCARPTRAGLIAAVANAVLVAAILLASPAAMRVQADEYMIAGAAYGIWNGLGPVVPIGWLDPTGALEPTLTLPDKRGYAVPLLFSIVHFALGYRFEHGFWVNALLGWGTLTALYALARQWMAPAAAWSAGLLLVAWPAFAWALTTQTLEAANLCVIVTMLALLVAAARRDDAGLATLAALLGAFAAQVRYESVLVGAGAWAVAAWLVARSRWRAAHALGLAAAALFFLPSAWQRAAPFDFDVGMTDYDVAFGWDSFAAHVVGAIRLFATPSDWNPSGPVIGLLAVAGVWTAARAGSFRNAPAAVVLGVFGLTLVAAYAVILAYAWVDPSGAETHRLMLVAFAAAALGAAMFLARVEARLPRIPVALIIGGACALLGVRTVPSDALDRGLLTGPAMRIAEAHIAHAWPRCRFAIVAPNAPYYVLRGHSSVTAAPLHYLWPQTRERMLANGVDAIVAVQIHSTTGVLQDEAFLPPAFGAREVLSSRVDDDGYYRVHVLDHAELPLAPHAPEQCPPGRHDGDKLSAPPADAPAASITR